MISMDNVIYGVSWRAGAPAAMQPSLHDILIRVKVFHAKTVMCTVYFLCTVKLFPPYLHASLSSFCKYFRAERTDAAI
ncbi:hypothetical protein ANTRET_LOCUS9270 [Anthophora retusa]